MLKLASTKKHVQALKPGGFMNKIYNLIIVCATLLFCANVQAQQEGKISGFIKSQDNKAIEAATVTLVKAKDTSVVKIAVTDKTGLFEFEKIRNDNYGASCRRDRL